MAGLRKIDLDREALKMALYSGEAPICSHNLVYMVLMTISHEECELCPAMIYFT